MNMIKNIKAAYITNYCTHYRVKTYETLAKYVDVEYYFFSAGEEWYWQKQHRIRSGDFKYKYLPGMMLWNTRIAPSLAYYAWKNSYDVYIKCINGKFALPVTYMIARIKRKPFILWTGVWKRLQTRTHRLIFPLTRYIYRHSDAIVVYGEHVKRYLITEGVPEERIFVAPHAVDNPSYNKIVTDSEKSQLRNELNIPPEAKIILYLGRMEESKGILYLLQAFEKLELQDTYLVLAGDGSELQSLKNYVHQAGIGSHVRFAGYVPVEETINYYAISYVYVLPSISLPEGAEPWGLTVNEAMNQGVPVIATDAVGAAAGGLVQHGVNGFIVLERDSISLASALKDILKDSQLRQRMSAQALQIISGWDNERMVSGYRQAIEYVTRQP